MSQNINKKLGCQANGGARAPPPRSANVWYFKMPLLGFITN